MNERSCQSPVVLVIFNRPELTRKVFERVREARPAQLLIVADGPRPDRPEDRERCAEARAVVEAVDWPCEVRRNYSESNLGCGRRIAGGFDWAFSWVERAIILEDDCLPDLSFFGFCDELLERFRDDERIMAISGDNFQPPEHRTGYSYYFSKYCHIWGWATWRRVWRQYDFDMKSWPEFKARGLLRTFCEDPYERHYLERIFDETCASPLTWDYQLEYLLLSQNGLAVIPEINLVTNIGIGPEATHTQILDPRMAVAAGSMSDLKHPPFMMRPHEFEQYTFDCVFGGREMKEDERWPGRLRRRWQVLRAREYRLRRRLLEGLGFKGKGA